MTLEGAWKNWSEATCPAFVPELVIAGRHHIAERILEWIAGEPSVLEIRADSPEEGLAFAAAAIDLLAETEREQVWGRALVVHDILEWGRAVAVESPLFLIPTFDRVDVAPAVRGGHHVLITQGRESLPSGKMLDLPRPNRTAAEKALLGMGFPERKAGELAGIARRSLLSLRRRLALAPNLHTPAWAHPSHAHDILPALLAGGWTEDQTGDREVLAMLANAPYQELVRTLSRWANHSDPPIRQTDTAWYLVSKADAWPLLARFLTADDLRCFGESCVTVLCERDPAGELPNEQRWMAQIRGHARMYSPRLRKGLAESLALMQTGSPSTVTADGLTIIEWAERIVGAIVSRANEDSSGSNWASLSDVLPLLAEAAPDRFLDAIDAALVDETRPILRLFPNADQDHSSFVDTPYVGLLWALETLAWSPTFLSRAALTLARLARLAPTIIRNDSPAKSLHEIFLLWAPQTAASLDQRFAVLDMLRTREPEEAWRLLLGLIPRTGEIASPTHVPRWQEWRAAAEPQITMLELARASMSSFVGSPALTSRFRRTRSRASSGTGRPPVNWTGGRPSRICLSADHSSRQSARRPRPLAGPPCPATQLCAIASRRYSRWRSGTPPSAKSRPAG